MHWPILSMERSMCRPLGAATFRTVRRVYVMPSKFMKYNDPPNPGQLLPQKMIYYLVCFILYRIDNSHLWFPRSYWIALMHTNVARYYAYHLAWYGFLFWARYEFKDRTYVFHSCTDIGRVVYLFKICALVQQDEKHPWKLQKPLDPWPIDRTYQMKMQV